MTDQLRISDSGEIEVQPLTEDGEPLYSPDTLRELFSSEAFQQLRGQMTLEEPELEWDDDRAEEGYDCPRCGDWIPAHRQHCADCGLDTAELR